MGVLKSTEFADDPKLQARAVSDPAHVTPGSVGSHVGKIQNALIKVDGAVIDGTELEQQKCLDDQAVVNYKRRYNILNYADQIDNIFGKKTIRALDHGLRDGPPGPLRCRRVRRRSRLSQRGPAHPGWGGAPPSCARFSDPERQEICRASSPRSGDDAGQNRA